MTRKEIENSRAYQTTDAAFEYCRKNHPHYDGDMLGEIIDTFEAGVEWGDTTMIDKACEWLLNNIDFYVETKCGEDFRVDIEQLLKDIRKAMEE